MQTKGANVAIVGAGAMGCLFAARLIDSGLQVVLVDVDVSRIDALTRDGVTLKDDRGIRVVPVRAHIAAQVTQPVDLVILFTKGVHSAPAIRSVSHLIGPLTYALTLQNGLGNAEIIAEVVATNRILLGVTDIPADLVAPTTVVSHGAGRIWLGAMHKSGLGGAEMAVQLLTRAGLNAVVDTQVDIQIWEKVAFNAALNSLAAITSLTVGDMDRPPGWRIINAVIDEVVATAMARGLIIDRARIQSKVTFALANHRTHMTSMLQDRLAGRVTEIETINGAIAHAAKASGVPAPVTETLADLVRLVSQHPAPH